MQKMSLFYSWKVFREDLGRDLNTLDKLRGNETVHAYTQWARKHV